MRTTPVAVIAVLLAAGCGPAEDDGDTTALLRLSVIDAPPSLTVGGGDYLFGLRYTAAPDAKDAPSYDVSELHVDIVARQIHYASLWSLTYGLYLDGDGDGRFGPGDVMYVRERARNVLGPTDSGTYLVRLKCGPRLLGAADWSAR